MNITKGEWELIQDEKKVEIFVKNISICAINPNIEEYQENAKLLLNAPKLYDALQDLVNFCKDNKVFAELEFAEDILNKCS